MKVLVATCGKITSLDNVLSKRWKKHQDTTHTSRIIIKLEQGKGRNFDMVSTLIHAYISTSSSEHLNLKRPRNAISSECKCKAQLEAHVSTKRRLSSVQSNRAHEPDLRHTSHHTSNATTEGEDGCDAWREAAGLVVVIRVVALEAALEDKVLGQGNTFIDS